MGLKCGRRVGMTTLPLSMNRISENVGASTSRNPKGLHGLYMDNVTFFSFLRIADLFWFRFQAKRMRNTTFLAGPSVDA
jgi:hypothetical protein